ncbi:MAG: EAL domain-containing protein [Desulfuromonadaceae bacterium]|nr:EAL domain-containing protein [Desulfuromonadaceae bacterium]
MVEALLDFLSFGGKPFLASLATGLSPLQIGTRLGGSAFFMVFGIYLAKLLSEPGRTATEIGHLNAVLSGIRRVNQLITKETEPGRLIQGVCRSLREALGCPQVFVVLMDPSGEAITKVATAGYEVNGVEELPRPFQLEKLRSFSRKLLDRGEVVVAPGKATVDDDGFFFRSSPGHGLLFAPLVHGHERLGVIGVSVPLEHIHNRQSALLFREVAEDIAFGVCRISTEERIHLQAQILDEIRDQVAVTDLDGRIHFVNRAICRALKRDEPELMGQSTTIFGENPAKGTLQQEIVERTRREGEWRGEAVHIAADGTETVMDCHAWLVLDAEGQPRYLAGIARDITDAKRLEEKLAESRREIKTLLDNLPGMAYRCRNDSNWEMFFISDGCRRLTGYDPAEMMVGGIMTYGEVIHPDDRQKVWEGIQEAIRVHSPFQLEYRIRRKDGRERWVWEQGRVVTGGSSGEVILEGLILDITQRHLIQDALRESEARFRCAQRIAHVGSWEFDMVSERVTASEEAHRIYGLPMERQWTIAEVREIALPEYRPVLTEALRALVENGTPYETDYQIRRPSDGALIDIHAMAEYDFERRRVLGALQDVTRQKRDAVRLQQTTSTLEAVYRASPLPLFALDTENRVTHWNQASEALFGWREVEVVGRPLPIIPESTELVAEEFKQLLLAGESIAGMEYEPVRRNGTRVPSLLFASPVWDAQNRIVGAIAILMDNTEQKKIQRKMSFLAYHDPLTGLSNRSHMKERFNQEKSRAFRSRSRIALCLIDLDRFKLVNDTFGHPSGDELLCQIAIRLLGFVRSTDLVCRPGGDEFLVMLTDIKKLDALTVLVRKIRDLFADPFVLEGKSFKITASIGISLYPDDGTEIHQLFKNADNAMYHAKEMGSNNFQFYRKEMDHRVRDRMFLENGLRHALDNGELSLHYQPQIDFASQRVIGAEALLRWHHPDQGLIAPARFIPVAEDTGMIIPIGRWVIGEACRQLRCWRQAGYGDLVVSVNLSTVQLFDEGFSAKVEEEMSRHGVEGGSLAFELTESVFMKDQDILREKILKLKSCGVEFYLDDFGTGYSSLSYLKRFEVDKLKIDKSFIRDINYNPDDLILVTTMIKMAHSLGIKVIAEGVETREQFGLLARHRCDHYQGFLCTKALPCLEFNSFLDKGTGNVAQRE